MDVLFTIQKSEFSENLVLASELRKLSINVKSEGAAIVFMPISGKVAEFLHLLRDNHITYNTNGDVDRGSPS